LKKDEDWIYFKGVNSDEADVSNEVVKAGEK